MNSRNVFRLILGTAVLSAAAATIFTAQTPAAGQAPGAVQAQRGAAPGQIAIPQPCTPEQLAAEAAGQPEAQPAGGGRGQRGVPCHKPDPRENLKPGLYDAGEAAKGMRLATTLKQPEGMFDPNPNPNGRSLDYANSDLAFSDSGKLAIQGNFHGLILYDIHEPSEAKLKTIVVCPGGQGDVSIWGNLAFMSVEGYGRTDCAQPPPGAGGRGAAPATTGGRGAAETAGDAAAAAAAAAPAPGGGRGTPPPDPNRMYGVRIFDISNPGKPVQLATVQTCRGSHTHSIAVDPKDKDNIYVYVSGSSFIRSAEEKAGCVSDPKAPNTSSFGIDVIKVPVAHPDKATVVSHTYLFADANTGQIASLYGRQQGSGEPSANPTAGCHDVTSFPFFGLLGGACSGNGLLVDIKDVAHPKRLDDVADAAFAFWHSATFNNDGTKLLFSDEWGGGTQPMCQSFDPPMWGGDAIYNIQGSGDNRHLKFGGYYKMPAWNTATENCVAHNGGLVPVPGRDIMSQGFYQGGATVFDFTDPAHVKEIAYFDRGPIDANKLVVGGYWSVYYNNGYLYGSEIARGLDVFELTPTEDLSKNEIDAAALATREGCGAQTDFNVQCQPHYTWPASFVVARAYLDQLTRDKALPKQRADAIDAAMKQVENSTGAARRTAETQLNNLAAELAKDAATVAPIEAKRMRDCASTIQKRDAELK
jgi:hypothetical protein